MRRNRSIKSVRPALLIRRDGNELYIESTAAPIRDPVGSVTGGVLVFHDVSESRELNRRLSYAASHDMLTELVNRREFEQRLERALKSAKARETSYAVLYLDLDQFKIVNDACGHNAGDELLSQIGALLKSKIRWRDTLARLGGDEFGVLLESCTMDEALRTAETLREMISEFRFAWDERTFRLGRQRRRRADHRRQLTTWHRCCRLPTARARPRRMPGAIASTTIKRTTSI